MRAELQESSRQPGEFQLERAKEELRNAREVLERQGDSRMNLAPQQPLIGRFHVERASEACQSAKELQRFK